MVQVDKSLQPDSPASLGPTLPSTQYAGQLFLFNKGLIQLAGNKSLVLEQMPDNKVVLRPFTGAPTQYWMRGHPSQENSTIDLPASPMAINNTIEFVGCDIVDELRS